MAKRPTTMRLDGDLLERVRGKVGARGLTPLVESLLFAWDASGENGSGGGHAYPSPQAETAPDPQSTIHLGTDGVVRNVQKVAAECEHDWSKRVGSSGLVTKTCKHCGAIA